VFAFVLFIMFIVFFVFILIPRHKSRESVKIGPHPRGHPSSLVHHKVGVSKAEDPLDANLLGQLEPMHQGLVFGDIV
jgi:hypothetical protein